MAGPHPLVRRDNGLPVKDGSYTALGYRTLTQGKTEDVAFTLASITGGIPAYANKMLVVAIGGDAYYRDDDTNPTTADGYPLFAECPDWIITDAMDKVRLIAGAGVSLRALFYC